MIKLGGTVSPRIARIKAWLRAMAIWIACGCAYAIAREQAPIESMRAHIDDDREVRIGSAC